MPNMYSKPVYLDYKNTYVRPDFNALSNMAQQMDARGNQAEALEFNIEDSLLEVGAMAQDKPRKDALIAKYESQIDTKLKEVGGDYTKMLPFVKEMRREVNAELKRGELANIQSNYNKYNSWYQENKKRAEEDGRLEDFNLLNDKTLSEYAGAGTVDNFQDLKITELVKGQDVYGDAREIMSQMKGDKRVSFSNWMSAKGPGALEEFLYEKQIKTIEELTPQMIQEGVISGLQNDPKYQGYLNQKSDLHLYQVEKSLDENTTAEDVLLAWDPDEMAALGKDPYNEQDRVEYAQYKIKQGYKNDLLIGAANQAAAIGAYKWEDLDFKYQEDKLGIERMKQEYKKQESVNLISLSSTVPTLSGADHTGHVEALKESKNHIQKLKTAYDNVQPGDTDYQETRQAYTTAKNKLDNLQREVDYVNERAYEDLNVTPSQKQILNGYEVLKDTLGSENVNDAYSNATIISSKKLDEYIEANKLQNEFTLSKEFHDDNAKKYAVLKHLTGLSTEDITEAFPGNKLQLFSSNNGINELITKVNDTKENLFDKGFIKSTYNPVVFRANETDGKLNTVVGQINKSNSLDINNTGLAGWSTMYNTDPENGANAQAVFNEKYGGGFDDPDGETYYPDYPNSTVNITGELDAGGFPLYEVTIMGKGESTNVPNKVIGTELITKGSYGTNQYRKVAVEAISSDSPEVARQGRVMLGKLEWATAVRGTDLYNREVVVNDQGIKEPLRMPTGKSIVVGGQEKEVYLKKSIGEYTNKPEYQLVVNMGNENNAKWGGITGTQTKIGDVTVTQGAMSEDSLYDQIALSLIL